jgi:hypothetical protein
MGWKQLLPWFQQEEDLAEFAEVVANSVFDEVWRRMSDRAPLMSLEQQKGYIRARSMLIVQRQVERLLMLRPLRPRLHATVHELAMERTIQAICGRLRVAPVPVVVPARRAA